MPVGKKIADAYARSLTAGAPRKSDRDARFTFDDRHSANTDDDHLIGRTRCRRIINHTSVSELNALGIP